MRKVKEKKSRGFQIFGIILSVLLVVALAFTVFEIFTLNVLPTNHVGAGGIDLSDSFVDCDLIGEFCQPQAGRKDLFITVSTCDDGRIRLGQLLSLYDR